MNKKAKILIVDDEPDALDIFGRHLGQSYQIDTSNSAANALTKLDNKNYDIVLSDVVMPGKDGLELLKIIKDRWPATSVLMISGKSSIEKAVEAMKIGADDFIEKPVEDLDILKIKIDKVLKEKEQQKEIKRLKNIVATSFDKGKIIGNSPAIQNVLKLARRVAPLDTTVLLTGETGVGKDLLAETIYKNSRRRENEFVSVNCGGLTENLLESMLFGHRKGAFTDAIREKTGYFQEANHGTLFLNEIAETSQNFQIKLLRTLEKKVIRKVGGDRDIQVDVRVIAATNKDIKEEVEKGNFRKDLYYRLNVFQIDIPPLRKRVEDIRLLANYFIEIFSKKYQKHDLKISDKVMNILISHDWSGNVRELKNAMEHAVAITQNDVISTKDMPDYLIESSEELAVENLSNLLNCDYPEAKDKFEKKYLKHILSKNNGKVAQAAKDAKIKRQNLYTKFKKHNIDVDDYR
ncbi:MAG: sigma-54-dependent Fis family transcriptional regulator [Candidatus Cloacimonetes bacterium]|nr:sigma-54-dependent Fis family transcriptional regulator [Candidatus Cloacimonadota bacterium]MBS3767535.1 sigma-54-dependent Fis family transcriptional regulator [Candidatus Cloacimonadota bacterium]